MPLKYNFSFCILFDRFCIGVLFNFSVTVAEYFTVFSRHFICGISLFFPYVDALAFSGPGVKKLIVKRKKTNILKNIVYTLVYNADSKFALSKCSLGAEANSIMSHSRRSRSGSPPSYGTNSNDPRDLERRIFVGNLPTAHMAKKDMEDLFRPYGKIQG